MVTIGSVSLYLALIATLASIVCLFLAVRKAKAQSVSTKKTEQEAQSIDKFQLIGLILVWASALALTICCVILVAAFLGGDITITYVVKNRSNSATNLALLFKLSGLWAGREGSLLFWAWLISLFSAIVALRAWRSATPNPSKEKSGGLALHKALDSAALAVVQLVLLLFLVILILDEANRPFIPLASQYLDSSGRLTGNAALWGMNALLEHWAMAIHPPTLFVGYAGLTIPFAYAVAALIVNDPSKVWVQRAQRYTLVSWLFLGVGIGLGAVWAYVVLGWGGYWGWDPVENASLLSWGAAVALVHSMTIYKQRGTLKRWAIMLACLTFAFVIVGTFITRSGIVESVHAFEENQLAMIVFGILIFVPLLAGILGLTFRRKTFIDEPDKSGVAESLMSKDVIYYLNNVIMLVCMIVLMYMTLNSALPTWWPFGGQALKAPAFYAIARPVGVLYCFIMAACPLLAWRKTDVKSFLKQARIPAIGALVVFALLCVYFITTLMPTYMQVMAQGGTAAEDLLLSGPFSSSPMASFVYFAAITLVGFLAASLLFFNALIMLIRAIAKRNLRVQTIGGFIAHMSIGILLVGLIGSSIYTYDQVGYLAGPAQDGASHNTAASNVKDTFTIRNYELTFVSRNVELSSNGDDVLYTITLAVKKDGVSLGEVSPQIQLVQSTGQQMLHAGIITQPMEDLFVVYWGDSDAGDFSLDVRVNPLVSFVWVGFGFLMLGTTIAAVGRRKNKKKQGDSPVVLSEAKDPGNKLID